ncbi:hypothetical protein LF1_11060 [Rubripirellula obstinata]|uniref:Uncharacterized protein n=1 Tax=Rubripirellula obstinata TaxID=406547 RepID=A0A5B1CH94_9BACT|nr:hypothetical protein [Rubripirellula obstinata]KAA1258584.1 hypothetical protein LF1_11060 [Rubripirellula obstinata]
MDGILNARSNSGRHLGSNLVCWRGFSGRSQDQYQRVLANRRDLSCVACDRLALLQFQLGLVQEKLVVIKNEG